MLLTIELGDGLFGVEAQQKVAAVVSILPLKLRVPFVVEALLREGPRRQNVAARAR